MCGTETSCFAFDPEIPGSIYVKKPERNSRSVASGRGCSGMTRPVGEKIKVTKNRFEVNAKAWANEFVIES